MLLPRDELQGSDFYNDWSAPQGYLAVQAAADRLGVLVATARTHLHRVLAKTGTRRQADLVRLILSSRHGVRRRDV